MQSPGRRSSPDAPPSPVEQSGGNYDPSGTKLRSKPGTQEAVVTAAFGMPKAQTGMAGGKYRPNTYDVNLVKRHDDNSAINTSSTAARKSSTCRSPSSSARMTAASGENPDRNPGSNNSSKPSAACRGPNRNSSASSWKPCCRLPEPTGAVAPNLKHPYPLMPTARDGTGLKPQSPAARPIPHYIALSQVVGPGEWGRDFSVSVYQLQPPMR